MDKRSNDLRPNVEFTSASPEVTGSCIHCHIDYPNNTYANFAVDCGSFQEKEHDKLNYQFNFEPKDLSFLLVTHAHIDHIGRIPFLVKKGFTGPIYCTNDTKLIMDFSLKNAVHIVKSNAGKKGYEPLFVSEDVAKAMLQVHGVHNDSFLKVDDHIRVYFCTNGHLIGSATILVQIFYEDCQPINIIFGGDYNDRNMFFDVPKLPEDIRKLPVTIFTEATYGYMNSDEVEYCFEDNLVQFYKKHPNGIVVIPTFALRTHEIVKTVSSMQRCGLINPFTVYVDGKMSSTFNQMVASGAFESVPHDNINFLPRKFKYLRKEIRANRYTSTSPQIIIASSGTGSYGPIVNYLQNMFNREDVLFHFTGYPVPGTIARRLYDAEDEAYVHIAGLCVQKKATVKFTSQFSAHAKRDQIMNFLMGFENPVFVIVTHGNQNPKAIIAEEALNKLNVPNVGILSDKVRFRVGCNGLIEASSTEYNSTL